MQKQTNLAHELRRGLAREAAIEIVADISARLVLDFWKNSERVVFIPERYGMGFRVLVDDQPALTISPTSVGKEMRPAAFMEQKDGKGALVSADEIEKGFCLASIFISEKMMETDVADPT